MSVANNNTVSDRIRYIDLKYQFNMGYVHKKSISLMQVSTAEMLAYVFTKLLSKQNLWPL